MEYKSNKP